MKNPDIVALIPVREGSQRVKNKNFVERAPKDLIEQNKNRQNAISLELSKIDSILSNL